MYFPAEEEFMTNSCPWLIDIDILIQIPQRQKDVLDRK